MGKNPAFQFYPGDWKRDPGVHACSFETRGIWFEMLCIMHDCDPYGHFALNQKPPTDEEAARIIGCTIEQYQNTVTELDHYHVMSRNCHGIIFSRRMVRDDKERQQWKERQRRHRDKSHANVTPQSRNCHTYLLSSSSSSSSDQKKKDKLSPKQTDASEEFLSKLRGNPAYQHIDIDNEFAKMDQWLLLPKAKGRKKTPSFILNWLNKIEKPLNTSKQNTPPTDPMERRMWDIEQWNKKNGHSKPT